MAIEWPKTESNRNRKTTAPDDANKRVTATKLMTNLVLVRFQSHSQQTRFFFLLVSPGFFGLHSIPFVPSLVRSNPSLSFGEVPFYLSLYA